MNATELWKDFTDISAACKWDIIKAHRDKLLLACAQMKLSKAGLTDAEQDALDTYVETLQDITFTYANPDNAVFPDAPTISNNPPAVDQLDARARRRASRGNIKKVVELSDLTPNQAAEWLDRKVHTGKQKSDLLNAITTAQSWTDLKQPMKDLTEMLYQSTEANKKIIRLLTAIRDRE